VLVPLAGAGGDLLGRELSDQVADLPLVLREVEVHGSEGTLFRFRSPWETLVNDE
jgi:hypothetical protein